MSEQVIENRAPGIRGPELRDPDAIARQIARQEVAALSEYAEGMLALLSAWQLLDAERRLGALRRERAFQLHRLELIEKRHPSAVSAALARAAPRGPAEAPVGAGPLARLIRELRRAVGAPLLGRQGIGRIEAGGDEGDEGDEGSDAAHER